MSIASSLFGNFSLEEMYELVKHTAGRDRGEVWDMSDAGVAPYGNGLDFLDWLKDFLDGKAI